MLPKNSTYHDPERETQINDIEVSLVAPALQEDAIRVMAARIQYMFCKSHPNDMFKATVNVIKVVLDGVPLLNRKLILGEMHTRFVKGMQLHCQMQIEGDPIFGDCTEDRIFGDEVRNLPSYNFLRACLMSPLIWSRKTGMYRLDKLSVVTLTQQLSAPYSH